MGCIFLICSTLRICNFCLFRCSNIVVFSEIQLSGKNVFFRCWTIEPVSERCIVSLLNRVVRVKPTYILLFSEIQFPKGNLNWYITLVITLYCSNRWGGKNRSKSTHGFFFQYPIFLDLECVYFMILYVDRLK